MNLSKNPKLLFALAGFTSLLGGAFLFVTNSGLQSLRAQRNKLQASVNQQKQTNQQLQQARVSLATLQTQLAHIERGVPDEAYVPTMLKDLQTCGNQHGILVTGVRPIQTPPDTTTGKKPAPKAYEVVNLELKGTGTYGSVISFVNALNTFPKIVAVHTVTIAPAATGPIGSKDHKLALTLDLRAYLFKHGATDKTASQGAA